MSNEKKLIVNETFDLAVQNHQNNKLNVAQDLYNQILKIDPGHVSTLNNQGVIFNHLRDQQKARDCYEEVIELNPNHVD